jgi:hypothetical protein
MTTSQPPIGTLHTLLVTTATGKQHTAIYVRGVSGWLVGKTDPALGWLWQTPTGNVAGEMVKRGLTYKWVKESENVNAIRT